MNKLIIIGNGFDLAHGLKTDYNSFIKWFVTKCFRQASDREPISNHLLNIKVGRPLDMDNPLIVSRAENLVEMFLKGDFVLKQHGTTVHLDHLICSVRGEVTSSLLNGLLNDRRKYNWVDIENHFYERLKQVLKGKSSLGDTREKLYKLNQELEDIKAQLSEYLVEVSSKAVVNNDFRNFVEEGINPNAILEKHFIKKEDIVDDIDRGRKSIIPKSIKFLDFNYTSLINKLEVKGDCGYIHIHGTLNNNNNPLIFGYGDEIDESYIEMEKTNVNEYLEHIKSFGYFRTNNYSRLVNFITNEPYVIYIWGHSCGLSDRTLLNMLFENDNCAGIKIFYYEKNGIDNFNELTQNISRHFKNKIKMRNRVFNKTFCEAIPQI